VTVPFDALRDALADRYSIERELGRGGMATVYLAHDRRHDRPVAIKVLRNELAAAIGAERFAREIRLLARLRHPFILPLHDSGVATGSLYYVMPYVDGESLGAKLDRLGRLGVREALKITREIADALAYAHGEAIVHRDVKPENILISPQGHALLADFGIARRNLAVPDRANQLTAIGLAIGTPTYMSPEQVFGEEEVSGASDIYSLGATLFEMLAGRPPFVADSASAIAAQHLTAPVPTFASLGFEAPAGIEAAIRKAMAKDPGERFATAADFAAALEPSGHYAVMSPAPAPPPELISVVVLPLTNVSGDKESEYLSDGITEELIGALARSGGLRVTSRTSAFAFKDQRVSIREIGERLNVAYALEGGVRRSGDRLRITAQLVRVSDDSSLWSETYERQLADVFAVQDDITRRIVATLTRTLRITPADPSRPNVSPRSVEAYNYYLLGRYHWNKRTETGMQQALELFQKAIGADPLYAPAHSGLADASALMVSNWFGPPELYDTAAAAARRAIELDPTLGEGYASLGYVKLHSLWDWAGAEADLRRAVELNPSYVPARQWLSTFLASTGRFAEALPLAEGAVQLDPLSILARVSLGTVYIFDARFEEAIRQFRQAVAMEPNFESAQTWLAVALAALGREEEALAHARRSHELTISGPASEATLALVNAMLGRAAVAEEILARSFPGLTPFPFFVAFIYAALGRDAETFEWLERAYATRGHWMYSLAGQPAFLRYHKDPRFLALLDRVGLPRPRVTG
jgi:serine/threonine protein kinase/tetratricopeptide (TPR) repeat protein